MLAVRPHHKITVLCYEIALFCHIKITISCIKRKTFSRLIGKINRKKALSRQRHIKRIIRHLHRPLSIIGIYLSYLHSHIHTADLLCIYPRRRGVLDTKRQQIIKRLACHPFFFKSRRIGICQIIRQNVHSPLFIPHSRICRI